MEVQTKPEDSALQQKPHIGSLRERYSITTDSTPELSDAELAKMQV